MSTLHDATPPRLAALALAMALALAVAACGKSAAKDEHADEGDKHAEHAGEKKAAGHDEHAEGQPELKLSREEAERAGIQLEEIKAQALGETVVVTATIHADQDRLVRVSPRIAGRILSAPAKLGDHVRAGQTLATMDSVEVGESHATWMQAQTELRIAEADFTRAESLNAEEIIPKKDFLRAQADRDKAAAAVRAAADRLRLMGGAPGATGNNVSRFSVIAPLAGTVIEKKVTLGELASPSEPMYAIADLSRVWIQAALPEAALAKVRVGAHAKVTVSAYPDQTFSGRVGHIGAMLDKDTRTVAARIELPNADGRLKPEMFATATIEAVGDKREAIALPDAAIVLLEGVPTVFVFEHGAYEARAVEPGERIAGRTLLKSGIQAGEQVVIAGAYALKARKLKSQLGHGH
ncbi:efflux RND transporter periplasmic adaptor subunit [Aquabacterium sp.]|uniref:efflux RND transporter periplasmic adaptor subunit n=1 Tax=Aquabacterium sp. TaxID=1872578 RepID=UPI002CF02008|nr:efflux RND transporter periplasmic adaptor subunit [Aquabacterium sp.]HSW04578.1 efflux RND transporter periplasmic adaptor subunit [Aquabacterium sp.]